MLLLCCTAAFPEPQKRAATVRHAATKAAAPPCGAAEQGSESSASYSHLLALMSHAVDASSLTPSSRGF